METAPVLAGIPASHALSYGSSSGRVRMASQLPHATACLGGHAILAIVPVGIADDVDARPGAPSTAVFVRAGIKTLGAARLPFREAKAVWSGARSARTRALSGRGALVGGPGCGALRVPVSDARCFLAGFGLGGAFPL